MAPVLDLSYSSVRLTVAACSALIGHPSLFLWSSGLSLALRIMEVSVRGCWGGAVSFIINRSVVGRVPLNDAFALLKALRRNDEIPQKRLTGASLGRSRRQQWGEVQLGL